MTERERWILDANDHAALPECVRDRFDQWWDTEANLPSRSQAAQIELLDEGRVEIEVYVCDEHGPIIRDGESVPVFNEYAVTAPPPAESFAIHLHACQGNAKLNQNSGGKGDER